MEAVWQIVALGLLGAVLAALLKKHTPELALLLAVAVCGAAALAAVRGVREVWAFLEDLLAAVEISSTLFLPLLKTAGIAVVTRIGADLCRDAGESAVASAVEMAGGHGGAAGGAAPDAGSVGGAAVAAVRAVWLACLLLLAMVPAWAADLPQEVTGRRSPGGGGAGGKGLLRRRHRSAGAGDDSSGGGSAGEPAGSGADLRGGAAVRGGGCRASHPGEPHAPFLPMAGAAAIAVLSLGSMKSLLGLGTQTIEELDVFSKALLPTLAAAVAAGGGAVTAGTGQVIAVCFADALITLIRGLLLPMTYFLAAAATADAMLPRHGLGTVAKAASRVVTWLLTGSLVLFTGYLTLSGAVSTSADALTVQVTRSAVGAMPVVGRILSDAAGSVLAGVGW